MSWSNGNNMQNGNFSQNNQQQNGEKKANSKLTTVYGIDATLDVTMWKSQSAIFTILTIKAAVGKDPSTNKPVYEQKQPKELPRLFLYPSDVDSILVLLNGITDFSNCNQTVELSKKQKFKIVGAGSELKITIEDGKIGDRTITIKGTEVLGKYNFGDLAQLKDILEVAYKKQVFRRLDMDEFAGIISGDEVM